MNDHAEDFSSKRLLVLAHEFSTFTKDQVVEIAPEFREVVVLIRVPVIAELYKFIPIHSFAPYSSKTKINRSGLPQNVRVFSVPLLYPPFDFFYQRLGAYHFQAVEKIIKREHIEFDLVHAHFSWTAGYVGAQLKKKYGCPFVLTTHGYDVYDLPFRSSIWQKKITAVFEQADHIITVSQNNMNCLQKLNISRPRTLIHNGYRSDQFHVLDQSACRKQLGLPENKRLILSVGRLAKIKGHRFFLEGIASIVKENPEIHGVIVGNGSLRRELEGLARKLGIENNITFAGARPHSEIPVWLNACDLFVLPSVREGFSVVQVEAAACGKPVLATRNGSSEEFVQPEIGILVPPEDSGEIARGIKRTFAQNWIPDDIVRYAMQYQWSTLCKKILVVYQQVLLNRELPGRS